MDLGNPADIVANVKPYDPQNSRLYSAITATWSGIMPPSPNHPLDRQQRSTVALWILQGATTTCQN